MKWTTEHPTNPGFYWAIPSAQSGLIPGVHGSPLIVEVVYQDHYFDNGYTTSIFVLVGGTDREFFLKDFVKWGDNRIDIPE